MAIVTRSDDVQASRDADVLVLTVGCLRRLETT
jgi:hypothetical protein